MTGLLKEAENSDKGSSHSARVAAWAHLGKHLGMFVEKLDHSISEYKPRTLADCYADFQEDENRKKATPDV